MTLSNNKTGRLSLSACLWLVLVCVIWGGNTVSIKFSNQGIPPLMAATLRSLISGVLVCALAMWNDKPILFPLGKRRHAIVIGVLFGLDFFFLYWGISFTSASRATIFLYSHPFWVILGAHFVLRQDRLSFVKVLGMILAFSGLLIVFRTRSPMLPEHHWVGDLMEISAAIFWAATTLYIKRVCQSVTLNHYQTLFAQLFFAIPVLAFGSFLFEQNYTIELNQIVIGALAYQILVVAFFSYLLWVWMIHNFAVSKLASFTFLAPMFGVIFAAVILKEPISVFMWSGLVLVCFGIFLVNR